MNLPVQVRDFRQRLPLFTSIGFSSSLSRGARILISLLALLLSSAYCTVLPGRPAPAGGGKGEFYIDLPLVSQENENWCGPAALSSILLYYRRNVPSHFGHLQSGSRTFLTLDQESLAREVFSAELNGSLISDLQDAAFKRGFQAELKTGSLEDLRDEIRAGRPPLVLASISALQSFRHYFVIIGYDDGGFLVRTQLKQYPERYINNQQLQEMWNRDGRLYLSVHPDSDGDRNRLDLEQRAVELNERGLALEVEAGQRKESTLLEAKALYREAARLSNRAVYYMNLANVQIKLEQWKEAEFSLKRGVELEPNHAASWNNLAHVLWHRGKMDEACQAILHALAMENNPVFRRTRASIEKDMGISSCEAGSRALQ